MIEIGEDCWNIINEYKLLMESYERRKTLERRKFLNYFFIYRGVSSAYDFLSGKYSHSI